MSFNDRAPRRSSAAQQKRGSSAGTVESSPGSSLSSDLQEYQAASLKLKEQVAEVRRRYRSGISPAQKEELDTQIQDIQKMETRLRNQLETQVKGLDQLPRTEIAQKRIALGKLSKDFERVKQLAVVTIGESQSIKVDHSLVGAKTNGSDIAAGDGTSVFRADQGRRKDGNGQNMQFQQQIQGQQVDDLIAEERERDIKKMNQDLQLVNEMFKDMAEIVEKQNPHIEQIAETTKESHERSQAGLEQVQQAAANQGGCVVA